MVTVKTMDASSTVKPYIDFEDAGTGACPLTYTVYRSESLLYTPLGIDEIAVGSYKITASDGENPAQYKMVIQASSSDAIPKTIFSPEITLTIRCPDVLIFTIPLYNPTHVSYVGSNLVGDGSSASYTFGQTVVDLPKCTQILDYEIID